MSASLLIAPVCHSKTKGEKIPAILNLTEMRAIYMISSGEFMTDSKRISSSRFVIQMTGGRRNLRSLPERFLIVALHKMVDHAEIVNY